HRTNQECKQEPLAFSHTGSANRMNDDRRDVYGRLGVLMGNLRIRRCHGGLSSAQKLFPAMQSGQSIIGCETSAMQVETMFPGSTATRRVPRTQRHAPRRAGREPAYRHA